MSEPSPPSEESRFWHGQASMSAVHQHELVIVRGEGAYVWDEQGNKLFDTTASLWYSNIGHGRGEIADAVAEQMRTLEAYHTFGPYITPPVRDLSRRLAAMAPMRDARIFLGSGGSDAVDTAAKLALRYWDAKGEPERRTIIGRSHGYHGLHAFGTSLGGLELNREGIGHLVPGTAVVETNDPDSLAETVERLGAETIAAFFCEGVIGTGGVIPPAPGYLEAVREICRDNGILFVADEVITGFGRLGSMFASELYGLEPDMLLFAKGVTSGYLPLGGVMIEDHIWEPFWQPDPEHWFRHGLTYSGHPCAATAALVNLDIIEREGLVARVAELEPVLAAAFKPLASHELVKEVRTAGLLAGVQLNDPAVAFKVAAAGPPAGLTLRAITAGTLQISPPFVVTAEELQWAAQTIGQLLDDAA